ncbi:Integral membrane protein GPR155 [Liparis tanakae]|uniref:Integral membrane protein GPR155 n=1 Tax=Liparis tanakae TaxID=230148 RepID=A0A4Z2FXK1_9TELE|nr:Integral membrane protein GPR155 [Liparis tanakae]
MTRSSCGEACRSRLPELLSRAPWWLKAVMTPCSVFQANTEKPSLNRGEQHGRSALLSDISKGSRLKKTETCDRSGPLLDTVNHSLRGVTTLGSCQIRELHPTPPPRDGEKHGLWSSQAGGCRPVVERRWSSKPQSTMEPSSSFVLIHGKNISHSPSAAGPHMSIDKLFPALLECFGIILCGYIAGRADVITQNQAQGLGNFVSKFALPALLFKNMVLLDFGDVIWSFLWSVLIAKVTVFVLVCVLTLAVAGPDCRYSKAGLYAIFATQSNDFALGYPIVDALYRSTYPEYLQYIYLVAPVSLMLLNPVGFALCEVQRWKQASHSHSTLGILGLVVLQVLKNPMVFMVIVGIIGHFALGQRIPAWTKHAVFVLIVVLPAVGTDDATSAPSSLIGRCSLVMPLVCKDLVDLLDVGVNSSSANHTSLSNFAFLYGAFPTAPSVAIYAAHYGVELEVVSGHTARHTGHGTRDTSGYTYRRGFLLNER